MNIKTKVIPITLDIADFLNDIAIKNPDYKLDSVSTKVDIREGYIHIFVQLNGGENYEA